MRRIKCSTFDKSVVFLIRRALASVATVRLAILECCVFNTSSLSLCGDGAPYNSIISMNSVGVNTLILSLCGDGAVAVYT
jgi:hypothetical protein